MGQIRKFQPVQPPLPVKRALTRRNDFVNPVAIGVIPPGLGAGKRMDDFSEAISRMGTLTLMAAMDSAKGSPPKSRGKSLAAKAHPHKAANVLYRSL